MHLQVPCLCTIVKNEFVVYTCKFVELFFLGNCSTSQTLLHQIQTNTVYQLRVQLSPAHSCHCVTLRTDQLFNGFLDWCVQPITNTPNKFCATENISTYISKPGVIRPPFENVECSHSFVMQNTMDTAVAYQGMFSCCSESQCLFPLKPLKIMNKANEM